MSEANLVVNNSILYRSTMKYFDRKLAQYNIGYGQVIFLMMINEHEGITMKELTRLGSFDKANTTKGISKLENTGYVRYEVDPKDKRSKKIYTTDKAKEIIASVYLDRRDWWDNLSEGLTLDEMDQFERLMDKVAQNAANALTQNVESIHFFGLQKLTLLDYPGKMAATLFTGGCNFKCPFCHNSDLVFLPENLVEVSVEDILNFLKKRQGILEGVAITGGEPLLHKGIEHFIRQVKDMGYKVKLDTNGTFPDRLKHLVNEGLVDYVAVDVKNTPERYAETIGVAGMGLENIRETIEFLKEGHVPYEFRTTVVKEFHTEEDIIGIAKWIEGADAYYLQSFVESDRVIQKGLHPVTPETLHHYRDLAAPYVKKAEVRGIE